ncbi:MAG: hypothetical protein M3R40_09130, partial [Pseudomonadota bacterium]|nr:hypothetical protein [Pseudomonadota bacterium]
MAKPRLEERVRERGREADTLEPRITTARKEAEANSAPYGASQRPYWPMRPQAWGGRARLEPSDRGQLR